MTINQETVNGKWLEIKGEIQKAWSKLTNDEIEQTKGDIKSIAGLVQQKYGEGQDKFQKKFSAIVTSVQSKKDDSVSSIKKNLKS